LKDEVYDYQIQVFEKELDIAIADGRTSITFIHGIGSGKLKNAIFAYLASHPFVDHYSNDYDQRYGYGATKVLLKHK
jgi:dsDNA-specific endonuclease/ATPase MutS2